MCYMLNNLVPETCTEWNTALVQYSGTRKFQTQPTNQTAQFWSHASVQVSGTSFSSVFPPITNVSG